MVHMLEVQTMQTVHLRLLFVKVHMVQTVKVHAGKMKSAQKKYVHP